MEAVAVDQSDRSNGDDDELPGHLDALDL